MLHIERGEVVMFFLDHVPELTDTEFDIYKYISNNLAQMPYLKIRDLAHATHTSTTSILRFCHKFGCSGFSEFKVKMKLYVEQEQSQGITQLDGSSYIHFLSRTNEPFFQEKLALATEIICSKEMILFIGMGSSNIIAEYGSLYFSSTSMIALRIEDPSNHPVNFLSQNLSDKICVIALSVSGETREIINYLNHLSFSTSSVISITNSENSTIAKLSDVNIPYYINREEFQGADITSQLPAVYILESLARSVQKWNGATG